ncbi:MAG TPA: hypothetical protein VGD31_07120, partial [Sphingobacteriaceae bacterium]
MRTNREGHRARVVPSVASPAARGQPRFGLSTPVTHAIYSDKTLEVRSRLSFAKADCFLYLHPMKQFFKKLAFFTAFIIPALVVTGFYLGDYWNFIAIVFSFLLIPLIDQSVGIDTTNVEPDQVKVVGEEFYYRFVTYVWTYVQIAFVIWAAYAVTTGQLESAWEWAAFVLSVSLVTGGIGITVAHELGHKKSSLERTYGKILLMTVCYMHFYIEHNRGHHVTVATP